MATSHAAGGWAALAGGRGAPAMLHPDAVCAVLGAGAAAALVGRGLCSAMPRGRGHQPGGARYLLQAPASVNRRAKPNILCRALC